MDFMEGDCFNFSAALHRLYGLPLVFLHGHRNYIDKWGNEEDESVCIHTLCWFNDNTVDFEGLKERASEVLTHYVLINEDYDATDIITFPTESAFWGLVHSCGGVKSEEAITKATEIILSEPRFDFLKKK
jgi:hypothetical protein